MTTRDVILEQQRLNQMQAVLRHLQNGGTITKISALDPPFRTTSLLNIIFVLRTKGHPIQKRWCRNEQTGSRWAEFYIEAVDTKAA